MTRHFYATGVLVQALIDLNIEYVVAPGSSYLQLRHMFQEASISAILAPPSILLHCYGFKDLQNLIIQVERESFFWIDLKQLTLKSQLSLDSWADIFLVYEYLSQRGDDVLYTP
jgi:hypothetical protein